MDVSPSESVVPWWGTYTLEEETGGQWDVGPSTIWLYRSARDWRVIHRPSTDATTTDPMAPRSGVSLPIPEADLGDVLGGADPDLQISRFSFHRTEAEVTLAPALADRPVVSRPEHPLFVPPGESVTLYLSTALWVRITLAESDRRLLEVPSHRMSDTWFGASTWEGTLCYATRTAGRLQLDKLPLRLSSSTSCPFASTAASRRFTCATGPTSPWPWSAYSCRRRTWPSTGRPRTRSGRTLCRCGTRRPGKGRR